MIMTQRIRIHRVLASAALTASFLLAADAAVAQQGAAGIRQWSQEVWETALRGDASRLNQKFSALPEVDHATTPRVRFKETYETHLANQSSALNERQESRERALEEMRDHVKAGDLSAALRSAVEAQTLGESLDAIFDDPEIRNIIDWAKSEVPEVKSEEDWLRAQELLYRLRTLYEDTHLHKEYQEADDELQQVNQRVALMSRYAPRALHELRNKHAERQGEEIQEFNSGAIPDWRERLDGVNHVMLRDALRLAASEHIENSGWRPLLTGGLESMRVLATTPSLGETFPDLNDQVRVEQWVKHIEEELGRLSRLKDGDIDGWTSSRILDRLVSVNDDTIELPENVIFREFGDGAMNKLDQFSEIIWPDNLRRFRQATEGNFVGVGILIRNNEKREIVVVNPLEGTPAYFAGVKPEDTIVEVDGESTVGWSLNDAVDEITGPRGVVVTLGLRREGEEDLVRIPIVRDVIKLQSVKGWWKEDLREDGSVDWNWYVDPISRIAYVKLTGFNEDTYSDLRHAWDEIRADGRPNGLILDLRFNPGGLLTSAVQISNLFMRRGVIVSGEDKDGIRAWQDQRAHPNRADLEGLPTVVLINKGAASGSEIVAGALQAHGAAVIVGERSYGKGSVQTVHQIAPNAALKLTTQYYRLPPKGDEEKGRLVHRRPNVDVWGVDPDIEMRMTPEQVGRAIELRQEADIIPEDEDGKLDPKSPDRPDINELITKGIDPQLETALLILQARALGTISAQERHAARD